MRIRTLITPAFACLAASAPIGAQAPSTDPLYHVEIIVFAYLNPDLAGEDFRHGRELSLPAPAPRLLEVPAFPLESLRDFGTAAPVFNDSTAAGTANPGTAANPATAVPPPADRLELIERPDAGALSPGLPLPGGAGQLPDGFRILRADELALTAEAARLRRLAPYRVLGHVGWAQTGVDEDRAVAVDLSHAGITNPVGTITVWVGSIRHAILDLEYFAGSGSFWSVPADAGLAPLAFAESYRLQQETNEPPLREARYIDHPMFGVLILVTPAPDPVPAVGAGGGPAA